jgi:hypothetical protein
METVSKQDLEIFRMRILSDIEQLLIGSLVAPAQEFDWLGSKAVRKMMDISAVTLQNLRITGKIRYKKVMGSYYYNRSDLQKLFENEN